MAGKIVSIEIGVLTTYIAELDYKANTPKIYHAFCIPTPDDAIADGSITIHKEFVNRLKGEFAKRNIKTKKAVFVMNSTRIASREVTIPAVKETKIHELLIANSAEFFPVDLQQYQLVYKLLKKEKEEKKLILSVLAVPNEIITSYCRFAEELGMEVEALDYLGNSVAQGMLKMIRDEVKVTIKVDETASFLTIMKGEAVELQRNISYGIKEAVDAVADSRLFGEKLSFWDGMDIMRQKTCMFRRLNDTEFRDTETVPEVDAEKLRVLRGDVTENVRALVGNIVRILDYYTSRNQETVIPEIWLLGLGADCSGLSKLLTNELNVKVKPLQQLDEVHIGKDVVTDHFRIAEYMAAIAAAIHPLEFTLVTGGKEKKTASGHEFLIPGAVFAVCMLASLGLTAYSYLTSYSLEQEEKKLERRVEALAPAEQIYNTYQATNTVFAEFQEMYAMTETPNDVIVDFLDEMEEKMPSDMVVSGLNATTEDISMNITVPTKESASKVLMQLRTFPMFKSVSTAGIEREEDESVSAAVSFTVQCTFAGGEDTMEEGTDDEQ